MAHDQSSTVRYEATGYQMIQSFELVNFRCFKSARIEGCKRINLIVGRNASGKTALLEGLFLALSSNPEPVFRLRQWRGFDPSVVQGNPTAIRKAVWGDIFHKWDKPVRLVAKGDEPHARELEIKFTGAEDYVGYTPAELDSARSSGVSFKYSMKNRQPYTLHPTISPSGIKVSQIEDTPTEVYFFAANQTYSSMEAASRLSDLSKIGKKDEFVQTFSDRYPDVEDLSVEITGGGPLIHVKLKNVENKLPLALVSGGMNKFAAILLSFPTSPRSVVLIDEIENGLFFKDLPDIWKMLLVFAKRYDAQIFATTHSGECIEGAADSARQNQDDFSVIQASRGGKLHQFAGEKFVWADKEGVEIRG